MDMSHSHSRESGDGPVNRFRTLKEVNEEPGHSEVITSVAKPISVELKVLLVDPEDQFKEY